MSSYVFGTRLSYRDYLQARSFEDSFRATIETQTREIVATAKQLEREHIAVLQENTKSIASGLERIAFRLDDVVGELEGIQDCLHWGFLGLISAQETLQQSLVELIKVAKTPAQTWAYEQFDVARDALRQELVAEAIVYARRAVDGFGGHTGYSIDHRFHLLLGDLYLGGGVTDGHKYVDLPLAKQAFLNAARYAKKDHGQAAARALTGAGWAAYCLGDMAAARSLSAEATSVTPKLAQAWYQVAKACMHTGDVDDAIAPLRRAVELKPMYAILAAEDGDFAAARGRVNDLLCRLRDEAQAESKKQMQMLLAGVKRAEGLASAAFAFGKYVPLGNVKQIATNAAAELSTNTYLWFMTGITLCARARWVLLEAFETFRKEAAGECDTRRASIQRRSHDVERANTGAAQDLALVGVFLAGMIVSFMIGLQPNIGQYWPFIELSGPLSTMLSGFTISVIPAVVVYEMVRGWVASRVRTKQRKLSDEDSQLKLLRDQLTEFRFALE